MLQALRSTGVTAAEIEDLLDPLALEDTISAIRAVSGVRRQARLWSLVASNPAISVRDLVPIDYPAMKPVVFHGKNSLPAFTEFQKICCRPDSASVQDQDLLWGYNQGVLLPVVGPGYYTVHDTEDSDWGTCAFDYNMIPPASAPGWPEIRANSRGLSRFVYNRMIDYMRRVARNVFIGLATRDGQSLNSYFLVVREL